VVHDESFGEVEVWDGVVVVAAESASEALWRNPVKPGGYSPSHGIYRVSAFARIPVWPLTLLLGSAVRERFAAGVLAVPDRLGDPVGEPDHVVLPAAVRRWLLRKVVGG